jgi:plasmid stabilization system protein ParE
MEVRYLDSARDEAFAAADYYEQQAKGLGAAFFAILDDAVEGIIAAPGIGAPYEIGTRRLVLPRFPYNLVYEVHDDLLLIIAVAHQRRHPDYWRRRHTDSS